MKPKLERQLNRKSRKSNHITWFFKWLQRTLENALEDLANLLNNAEDEERRVAATKEAIETKIIETQDTLRKVRGVSGAK